MKPYSVDLRKKVLEAYQQGEGSYRQIAQRFRVSLSFIRRLIPRYQKENTIESQPIGRPQSRKLTPYKEQILEYLDESKDLTLSQLCDRLKFDTGVEVSVPTMCRFLKDQKLTRKKNQPLSSDRD